MQRGAHLWRLRSVAPPRDGSRATKEQGPGVRAGALPSCCRIARGAVLRRESRRQALVPAREVEFSRIEGSAPTARAASAGGGHGRQGATGERRGKIWGRAARTGSGTWCWSGPAGSGKTTLTETLLAASGAITRAGSVRDGTTVCDHEEAEHTHGRTISLAVAPLVSEGTKINLIDTPGYADFVGELRAGLRAADCALFVVAANEGVDDGTRALWRECASVGMPRAVVITKLDQARADYDGLLAQARAAFGDRVMPLFVPVREGDAVVGLTGLLAPAPSRRRVRRAARRPDRGGDRGVRGRDPDGPLRRRRGDRREGAARRPRARGRAGDVLPRRPGVLADGGRLRRAARPRRPRLPVAGRAPAPPTSSCPSGAAAAPITGDPDGPAGRRGREDDQRPVRRPAQPGARLLRHPGRRPVRPRVRPLHGVLRRRGRATPTTTRTRRSARWPTSSAAPRRRPTGRRGRHLRDRPADPGRDRRHALRRRRPAGAAALVDARAPAAGRDRRAQQGRRRQAVAGARPARRRGPVAADRQQRRDPPAGAVVHGRVPRRGHPRAPHRAVRRPRRPGAVRGVAARDVLRPRRRAGPARQAVRRARPVRRVPPRGGAAARGRRVRVRRQGRRRLGPPAVHPQRREGRARPDGARCPPGPPRRRRTRHPHRRQGAQRRLLRHGVPDRRRARPARGRRGDDRDDARAVRHGRPC